MDFIKDIINAVAHPKFSFTAAIILFFFFFKRLDKFLTKRNGWIFFIFSLLTAVLFVGDKNFYSIIGMPDNFPMYLLIGSVGFFTWFSLYKGVENDRRIARGEVPLEATPENKEKVWAWPNLIYTELFASLAFTIFWIAWAIFLKAPLEEPADPTWAPKTARAPWYFLGLQEMLVYFDPWIAGVLLPGLIVVGLMAIPFLDTNPKGNGYYCFKERKFAITAFCFGWLVLWVFLIIVGTFLRGPNWVFFGPFEMWDSHKVVAESNINISEIFWIKFLGTGMPRNIFLREWLGLLSLLLYFGGGAWWITKKWGAHFIEKCGQARYCILVFLILMMASLPVKMYLRWLFNLKYIVAMPEFELNI